MTIDTSLLKPSVNRRSTDLHTRIAELGVAFQHCELKKKFFFKILEKKLYHARFGNCLTPKVPRFCRFTKFTKMQLT